MNIIRKILIVICCSVISYGYALDIVIYAPCINYLSGPKLALRFFLGCIDQAVLQQEQWVIGLNQDTAFIPNQLAELTLESKALMQPHRPRLH